MTENPWIEHDGGPMPVAGDVLIEVRLRCGDELYTYSSDIAWDHRPDDAETDVVAYRLTGPSA